MEPEVVVHDDAETLAAEVASRLLERLEHLQQDGGTAVICLTGGTIADAIHREVARRAVDSSVDWSRVELWWGDERFVARESPDRNARQAASALLDVVDLTPHNVHPIPSSDDVASVEEAAEAYSSTLRAAASGVFDIVMLGVGPDGHIASLFPGQAALDVATGEGEAMAVAVHDSPKPPPLRVSLTFAALNRANAVWFLVSGAEKSAAVAAALGGADPHEIPATGVDGIQETIWLIDQAAASQLNR